MTRAARILLALLVFSQAAAAQQVLIDQGINAAGLHCFPLAAEPNAYVYVPNTVRLASDEAGRPRFSFLRYVTNEPSAEAGSQGITSAEGGGILHFIVTLDTPAEAVEAAQAELRQKTRNQDLVLRGPILFETGRYKLVSATITGETRHENVLATGNAPVLEGSQLALSFALGPERATRLLESLSMQNPDIQLAFEMVVRGISDSFDAHLDIHWDAVLSHEGWGVKAGFSYYVGLGADIKQAFDELMEDKAIDLHVRGGNPNMEALLDNTYMKLLELLFEPIPPERSGNQLYNMLGTGGVFGATNTMSIFNASFAYEMRDVKRSGTMQLDMSAQSPRDAIATLAFGIGDLWKRLGDDPRYVKTVNLADPAFQQREIRVAVDGGILPEFDQYINSVTTTLRKQHQNGHTTLQEVVIDRKTFDDTENDFRMIYGWNGDDDRGRWLHYDYRTHWSFKGGGAWETGWVSTDSNVIDLYSPYRRKRVRVMGDLGALAKQGVRAVVVRVSHPFFAETKQHTLRFKTDEPLGKPAFELTLPQDERGYAWEITWVGTRKGKRSGTSEAGVLFMDELPPETAPEPPAPVPDAPAPAPPAGGAP
jgi:hypothetical protein